MEVLKNNTTKTKVECVESNEALIEWLRKAGLINPREPYVENKRVAPFDEQTVLYSDRFKKSVYKNKGRRAYWLQSTQQLWVVDASVSHSYVPHIEVFDGTTGAHLGTSEYNKIQLDTKYKDKHRINLAKTYPID